MIEDYQAKRRRSRRLSRVLLVLGVVLAVLAGAGTYLYAVNGRVAEMAPPPPALAVVVAARDLPVRTTLAADDLKVVRTAPELAPPGALTSTEAAVGRITTVPMSNGEVVLPSKFTPGEGLGFSVFPAGQKPSGSAPDFRAMSISIPDAQAVGGSVQAGDIVDVVFAVALEPGRLTAGSPSASTDYAARITYERVPVLARTITSYTIRVEAAQAERIAALAISGAQINLLLRAQDDTRSAGTRGALFSVEVATLLRGIPR
ncbi:MAG: Flp pilus assembly protein CpaB [Chloroflexi bacterium]|nr:Flp pilus assembly protein CpaB [Chloroflexota bacterium]